MQSSLNGFVVVKKRPFAATLPVVENADNPTTTTTAAASSAASSSSALTAEQRQLIEAKKQEAMRKRRAALGVDLEEQLRATSGEWHAALQSEFSKPYMAELHAALSRELAAKQLVLPPMRDVFNTFRLAVDDVRVVILGQDPYPGVIASTGTPHAMGLAFSVHPQVRPLPASLKNIFTELQSDIPGFVPPPTGDLSPWVQRGVMLLNTTLTVRAGAAASHAAFGWAPFTDAVISTICKRRARPVVFILWGKHAQEKEALIKASSARVKHVVIKAVHPSPLSASKGFFGSKCFSAANAALVAAGEQPIDWSLTPPAANAAVATSSSTAASSSVATTSAAATTDGEADTVQD